MESNLTQTSTDVRNSQTLEKKSLVEIDLNPPKAPLKEVSPCRSEQVTSFNNLLHYSPLSHTNRTKVWHQRISRRSLNAEMRLAALKAGGSEALPRSRLPGNCCYATAGSPPSPQSKHSVSLAEAELHHDDPNACEKRCFSNFT